MIYNIRNITSDDINTLKNWWEAAGEKCPSLGLMPFKSHFILELDNKPVMSMGLFLTNSEVAYVENFIASPDFKNYTRDIAGITLSNFIINFAKELGYKRLFCFTHHEALSKRYKQLGMENEVSGIYALTKNI